VLEWHWRSGLQRIEGGRGGVIGAKKVRYKVVPDNRARG
jgi:hypothetical protein